jgi:aldehyde decarbonylase
MWDYGGLVICLLLHMGPTEAIYYWLHRALHNHYLYTRYHSHHHALFIPEANSGTIHRHCSMPLS